MPSNTVLIRLLIAALLLPAAVVVSAGFGRLLEALGDASGGAAFLRAASAFGAAWVLALLALVLAVAVREATKDAAPPEEPTDRAPRL